MDHEPRNEDQLLLRKGDVVWPAGNHWNGVGKGRRAATGEVGLYPVYKTRDKVKVEDFPTYPHIKV